MSTQIDCPICMDCIEFNRNCVTTECGHCFHASCLMTSVAHNGFGCPYCRTVMAEEPTEEELSEVASTNDNESVEGGMFNDNALRGYRLFFNNINGEAHDAEDLEEEDKVEEEDPIVHIPTTEFVAQRLREEGITFEQLVHMMCNLDHEEFNEDAQAERFEEILFGKIRMIVSNYKPEEQEEQEEQEQEEQHYIPGTYVSQRRRVIPATPRRLDFDSSIV